MSSRTKAAAIVGKAMGGAMDFKGGVDSLPTEAQRNAFPAQVGTGDVYEQVEGPGLSLPSSWQMLHLV